MTEVVFYFDGEILSGFHIKGHATASAEDEQGRLVCAAVSSAAILTANTVTEIIGAKADVWQDEGELALRVTGDLEESMPVLAGFMLHMEQLSGQYQDYIRIHTEVS